jgi:hypothetical protein
MKIPKILAFITLWLGLASQLALADDLSRELIKKAGIEPIVAQIPASMAAGVQQAEQQGLQVDDKFRTAWAKAVKSTFRVERVLEAVEKGLQKLTVEERRGLIAYYDTPAGKRVRTLEEQSAAPEAQAQIVAFAQKFMADPKNGERTKLYQQIDQATNASALSTELVMKISYATAIGMANVTQGAQSVDTVEMEKQVEAQRPQMMQQMQQSMLLTSAYTYREMSVAEVNAYVKFLQAPTTKKFTTIVLKSLTEELALQARNFGTEIAKNFKRKDA